MVEGVCNWVIAALRGEVSSLRLLIRHAVTDRSSSNRPQIDNIRDPPVRSPSDISSLLSSRANYLVAAQSVSTYHRE